jgi:repressor LexA
MPTPFTAKQGQYLAFIYYYSKIHGMPPAEADFRRFFRVTPPVVHQMIKTLHARGFIDREPGKARTIRLDSLVQNCQIWTNVGASVRWRRLAAG